MPSDSMVTTIMDHVPALGAVKRIVLKMPLLEKAHIHQLLVGKNMHRLSGKELQFACAADAQTIPLFPNAVYQPNLPSTPRKLGRTRRIFLIYS